MHNLAFSRRTFLASLSASFSSAALANAPRSSLIPTPRSSNAAPTLSALDLRQIIAEAKLSGIVSAAVADARSGKIIEAFNPNRNQPPASVAKISSALFAVETLGPGHRFRTRLLTNGRMRNGVLDGDLILRGGSDPQLDTSALNELARQLKELGVVEIKGDFVVEFGPIQPIYEIDSTQPDYVAYNPAICGLNLNYNRIYFEWARTSNGYNYTLDARTEELRPSVSFAKMEISDRTTPVYGYQYAKDRERWSVARAALGAEGGRWLPVRNPGVYAGDVFRTLARSHGLLVGPARVSSSMSGKTLLAEYQSPSVLELSRNMLRFSTNLTAEILGLSASGAATLPVSGKVMSNWLAQRYQTNSTKFVDHSGLGDQSEMTPVDMVKILSASGAKGILPQILKPYRRKNERGEPIYDDPNTVLAKTGTLNFVSGLAGYIKTAKNKDLAFAIFSADEERRAKIPKAERERPRGARTWNRRARSLQQALVNRWISL